MTSREGETAQSCFDSLRSIVKRINETCGLDQTTHSLLLHSYGKVSIHELQHKFNEDIKKLKLILQQHQIWSKTERELLLNRYLKLMKDQSVLEDHAKKLKTSLDDCYRQGSKALKDRNERLKQDSTNISALSRISGGKQTLLRQMQDIADEFGLQCDVDDGLTEQDPKTGEPLVVASLSSTTLLIDVLINEAGEISGVRLITDENENEQFDNELTKSLRNNFDEFKAKVQKLNERDVRFRRYAQLNMKALVQVVESDFMLIHKLERQFMDDYQIISQGHGIVRSCCEGLYIDYYASPVTWLQKTRFGSSKGTQSAMVWGIETVNANVVGPLPFPETSQVIESMEPATGRGVEFMNTDAVTADAFYVLQLVPPVAMTKDTMRRIISIIHGMPFTPSETGANAEKESSLQRLLTKFSTNSDIKCRKGTFEFVYTGAYTEACLVERIPFFHVSQIRLIWQVLRQQQCFNELFASCFVGEDEKSTGKDKLQFVEIVSDPPYSIGVTFLYQKAMSLACLQVNIGLNGELDTYLDTAQGVEPPCSNSYVTKLLKTSYSIPLTLSYVLKKCN